MNRKITVLLIAISVILMGELNHVTLNLHNEKSIKLAEWYDPDPDGDSVDILAEWYDPDPDGDSADNLLS